MQSILRLPAVQAVRGISRTTCYQQVAAGLMTPPVKIGARAVGWPAHEIAAINSARIAGMSEDEIRALVKRLQDARRPVAAIAA